MAFVKKRRFKPNISILTIICQKVFFTKLSIFFWFLSIFLDICVYTSPIFSSFTSLATYLLTAELWNNRAGLIAAIFMSIIPGYTQRSVAGSFDNEGIAIFALQMSFYAWIKASRLGSITWSLVTALLYMYMTSAWDRV